MSYFLQCLHCPAVKVSSNPNCLWKWGIWLDERGKGGRGVDNLLWGWQDCIIRQGVGIIFTGGLKRNQMFHIWLWKCLTYWTRERTLRIRHILAILFVNLSCMLLQIKIATKSLLTNMTSIRFVIVVCVHVESQVVHLKSQWSVSLHEVMLGMPTWWKALLQMLHLYAFSPEWVSLWFL